MEKGVAGNTNGTGGGAKDAPDVNINTYLGDINSGDEATMTMEMGKREKTEQRRGGFGGLDGHGHA